MLVGQRQWRTAGFFQDDWKVLPNLTLNLGLRYEFDQPWYEVNNKTGNVLLDTGTVDLRRTEFPQAHQPARRLCSNRACYEPTYNQFMPRIGFAYQATNRLVVRGGYGATSFFEGNAGNQRLTSLPPSFCPARGRDSAPPRTTPASGGLPLFRANKASVPIHRRHQLLRRRLRRMAAEYEACVYPGVEPDHGICTDSCRPRCRLDI